MRIQYLPLVAAAALTASAHGLQVVSDSASALQRTDEAGQQSYIKDKTERFLTSEDKELTSTGYASRLLQEGDNGRHLRDYDNDSDSYLATINEERKARSKRKKRRSKMIFGLFKKSHKNKDKEKVDGSGQTGASNGLTESDYYV